MKFTCRRFFVSALVVLLMTVLSTQVIYAEEYDKYDTYDYEEEEEVRKFITTVNLNLRSGPSTRYTRITLLPVGTIIIMDEFNPEGFSAVTFGELSGYVSSEFIEPVESPEDTEEDEEDSDDSTPPPIPTELSGNIEKIPWSEMRQIMPTGTDLQIYDIRTGLTYFVRNFSNGSHADVETITQRDTDIMRQTSGGRFSWDVRPVLVTFNGRIFAAAIHTMPHAGYTIRGNGMNGHVCLHFYGSRPHNGNRAWQAEMQAGVMEAFNSR